MGMLATLSMDAVSLYAAAVGVVSHEDHWMMRVRQAAGPSCQVTITGVTDRFFGFNGFTGAIWTVRTCKGFARYSLSYYPPQAFPLRWDAYEVVPMDDANR